MIGFFGGSFDPVHFGHLKTASALKQELNLSRLFLMPCAQPVHKNGLYFSDKQRLKMLQLACQTFPSLLIDKRELNLKGKNYTIETLKNIRADYKNKSICFIMGADNYAQLTTWRNYQDFQNFAHLVILPRPDYAMPKNQATASINALHLQKNGLLYFAKTQLLEISASQIQHKIRTQQSLSGLLPKLIIDYINTSQNKPAKP